MKKNFIDILLPRVHSSVSNCSMFLNGDASQILFHLYFDLIKVGITWIIAGSIEAAYSLNWGAPEIWGKGGGETLTLLW